MPTHSYDEIDLAGKSLKDLFFSTGFISLNVGSLTPEALHSIARQLGRPLPVSRHNYLQHRYIQDVSPSGLFRREAVPWHNDFSYSQGNYDGTLLYMLEQDTKTPTFFADTQLILQKLSASEIDELSGVTCHFAAPDHYHDLLSKSQLKLVSEYQSKKPLLTEHPVTRELSLYFSPATLIGTEPKINITRFLELADLVSFKKTYEEHDLVIFDNLRWMHRRPAFSGHRRLLRISFSYV